MFDKKENIRMLPTLDLHGEKMNNVASLVNMFINYNLKMNNKYIVIVHGLLTLKDVVHEVLRKNSKVQSYYVDDTNNGCTIVGLTEKHNMKENIDEKLEEAKKLKEVKKLYVKKFEEAIKKDEGLQKALNELKRSLFETTIISNIKITNLFGLYNYSVDFKKNNVLVIHAPNGCGKSTFLKIIKKAMEMNFKELKKMPFAKIEMTINDRIFGFDNMNNNYALRNVFCHEFINTEHLLIDNLHKIDPAIFNDKIKRYLLSYTNSRNNRIYVFNEIMEKFFCYEKTVEIQTPMVKEINEYGSYIVNSSNDIKQISNRTENYLKIQYVGENSDVPNTFKNGEILNFEDLSSGEQYVIKLFFKLIFELKDGSLIMLDEPEISLHVEWQELLIESIYEIANSMGIKVLIMTHSPYLLNYENIEVGNVEYEIEK